MNKQKQLAQRLNDLLQGDLMTELSGPQLVAATEILELAASLAVETEAGCVIQSVASHRFLKGAISNIISNGFGSHPENKTVNRTTSRIYAHILERFEPVRTESVTGQDIKPTDKRYLLGRTCAVIINELEAKWDGAKAGDIAEAICARIAKEFLLVKRPVYDSAEATEEQMRSHNITGDTKADTGASPQDIEILHALSSMIDIENGRWKVFAQKES